MISSEPPPSKREGFRMFNEMLEAIEDRGTDIIFKVHLEAGARARSIWTVSQTTHDEVGQFAMAKRQGNLTEDHDRSFEFLVLSFELM
jgi:preprotein translocase subunit SecA